MKKKAISILLTIAMFICLIPPGAVTVSAAAPKLDTSYYMDGTEKALKFKVTKQAKDEYTLTITGTGAIPNVSATKYGWYDTSTSSSDTTAYGTSTRIKHLVIGEGVTNLPNFAGSYDNLQDITVNSKNFNADIASAMSGKKNLKTITFTETVETISFSKNDVFTGCTALEIINLPASLKNISVDPAVFSGDTNLSKINLSAGSETFFCENNVIYNKDGTAVLLAPIGGTEVTPIGTVKRIASGYCIAAADMLASADPDDNIRIALKHNKDGQTVADDTFFVGEIIKAEVTAAEGELPDGLFFAWLGLDAQSGAISNSKTAHVAGFDTPDTYIDGTEYLMSPDALYGAVKSTYLNNSVGTAYCRFAVCRVIDGQAKIVAYRDFIAAADTSTHSYDNAMKYIADGNTVTMIKGERRSVKQLLARSGIAHITCTSIGIGNVRNVNNDPAITVDSSNITANEVGTGIQISFETQVMSTCDYHNRGSSPYNTLRINVIDDPQISVRCADVVVNAPADGFDYFIGTAKGIADDGKVVFSGLAPCTQYVVRMQKTDPATGAATYTFARKLTNGSHDFSSEIAADDHLKTPATYTEKAVYFKSCAVCGVRSETDTFEEGVTLTEERLSSGVTDVGGLMGRQGKTGDPNGSGRTIIGLTQKQIEKISDKLIIVGGDEKTQYGTEVVCAYTYFYNGSSIVSAESKNCAAFIIIDGGACDASVSGYGYYRLYADEMIEDEEHFLFDVLHTAPDAN